MSAWSLQRPRDTVGSMDSALTHEPPFEVWTQASDLLHAAAAEVTLFERLLRTMNGGEVIGLHAQGHRGEGRVLAVTAHAVILDEIGGAQSWWARAHLEHITGLPRERGSGSVRGEGIWWRRVRAVDLVTASGDALRGRVEWVGADHVDVLSGTSSRTLTWSTLAWARSQDAWLYD